MGIKHKELRSEGGPTAGPQGLFRHPSFPCQLIGPCPPRAHLHLVSTYGLADLVQATWSYSSVSVTTSDQMSVLICMKIATPASGQRMSAEAEDTLQE